MRTPFLNNLIDAPHSTSLQKQSFASHHTRTLISQPSLITITDNINMTVTYESIPEVDSTSLEEGGEDLQYQAAGASNVRKNKGVISSRKRNAAMTALLLVAFLGVVAFCSSLTTAAAVDPSAANAGVDTDMEIDIVGSSIKTTGSKHPPACTLSECYASNCNHEVAPYTCLFHNGGPHGGCSPTPWYVPETCSQQCDLSGCDDLEIPDSTETCDVACDDSWCIDFEWRLCGSDVPYQCNSGSATFGCTGDKLEWTLKTASTTCSACCNINTC
jgi:hypothetical protein